VVFSVYLKVRRNNQIKVRQVCSLHNQLNLLNLFSQQLLRVLFLEVLKVKEAQYLLGQRQFPFLTLPQEILRLLDLEDFQEEHP